MNEAIKRGFFGTIYVLIMLTGVSYSIFSCRILFIIIGIISYYEIYKLRKEKPKLLAFIYVLIPFILIQMIINNDLLVNNSQNFILFILIQTWTFDTFAYLFGVNFGKHRIKPSISPKKSWEGFIGGAFVSSLVSYMTYSYYNFDHNSLVFLLTIILPFTATLGDFIESHYKREAGVKDSGNIIPGHGGILDRIDALMITIPTFFLIINIL
tara:strand:- start:178 stop:810 length:633 start_codon:yes stop_codon:yes gene_type:complete